MGISYTGKMTSLYWIRAQIMSRHWFGAKPLPETMLTSHQFNEMWKFSFPKMCMKILYAKWQPPCSVLKVLSRGAMHVIIKLPWIPQSLHWCVPLVLDVFCAVWYVWLSRWVLCWSMWWAAATFRCSAGLPPNKETGPLISSQAQDKL